MSRSFASDNWAGVHPEVLDALSSVNEGHVPSYGHDIHTERAKRKLRSHFGDDAEIFFVFSGTGANVLSLESCASSFNAVICAETAHIHTWECGAAEKHVGCKLLPVATRDGKIDRDRIAQHLRCFGDDHSAQPSVVSITQATEYGTVYTPDEIQLIASFAHEHGLKLHMDGARIMNAAASLGVSLMDVTGNAGVDVLSFGGTKNGMIAGEAVIFFDPALAQNFPYRRMQGMQLSSKMRFIAAQFDALFTDDLWLRSASHSNRMALLLGEGIASLPGCKLTQLVQANEVFAILPRERIADLQNACYFSVWQETISEARFVASFDTTEADVTDFLSAAQQILGG